MADTKISGMTLKSTAGVAADVIPILDSEASLANKKITLANLILGNLQTGTGVYYTTGGTTTAYTLTPSPAIAALAAGQRWWMLVNATNTAAATLAVSGKAATAIKKWSTAGAITDIVAGDMVINTIAEVAYDGTQYLLLNPALVAAATAATAAACSGVAAGNAPAGTPTNPTATEMGYISGLTSAPAPLFKALVATTGGLAGYDCAYVLAAGTAGKACGSAVGTVPAIGFAPAAGIAQTVSGNIQTSGVFTNPGWSFTPGLFVYVDPTTAGLVTQTPPGAGKYAQVVGIAVSATALQIVIGPVVLVTSGIALPSAGGTGIANSDASTITITGAHALGVTITGDTTVTLPTSGTVTTLEGRQAGTGIYYAATTADNAAYVITPSPAIAAYAAGHRWDLLPGADNTGAATLNVSGKGARNILKRDSTGTLVVLAAADLKSGQIAKVQDDGTQLELMNPTPAAASTGGTFWSFGVVSPT